MRIILSLLIIAGALGFATETAAEEKKGAASPACKIYAATGRETAKFMLPLTVEQLVKMTRGEAPDLLMKFTVAITEGMGPEEMKVAATLSSEKATLLGNIAGQTAMQLLMGAQASEPSQVYSYMLQQCDRVGVEALIDAAKKAQQAIQSTM